MKDYRPRLKGNVKTAYKNITKNESRVLCVGDLHLPFELKGYLQHAIDTYAKFNCNRVVMIGDIIDNYHTSYFESSPDADYTAGKELEFAIKKLSKWYEAFPKADVTIGNHDRLVRRKAFTGGIPKQWIKEYSDVLGVPNWNFTDRVVIDDVQYIHGESGKAIKKAKDDMFSTVQGHRHTEMGVEFAYGANKRIMGVSVGCGIDHKKYAFAYGKHFKLPAIGVAVIINGNFAINVPLDY